jgi:biopolymer transport protein ExbD
MLSHRLRVGRARAEDINITAFMNLMAVLIPFLLSVAVFTRFAVLETYLPPPEDPVKEEKPLTEKDQLILTITITERGLIVANGNEIVAFLAPEEEGLNLEGLSEILQDLKARYPEEENAIILSTPMIHYETLVAVMDTTRMIPVEGGGARPGLFPHISLGEVQ